MDPAANESHRKAIERIKSLNQLKPARYYLDGILNGELSILSKAITLVESTLSPHQHLAQKIIELCLPYTGKSIRIGITGVPGVGKSSFIESYGTFLVKEQKKRLAVLAIDPSSSVHQGSILGDKTRMEELSMLENVFIRPSPSANNLGGVAKKTRESILLCEAAGFDTLFIETVGVGQSETTVKSMVDFFLLLMLAGAGDELQGIKRGIMEMADAICITKSDSGNELMAKKACRQYKNALHLFPAKSNNWIPEVWPISAMENKGLHEVFDLCERFKNHTVLNGSFAQNRLQQNKDWMYQSINDLLKHDFYQKESIQKQLPALEQLISNNQLSPYKAAESLLETYRKLGGTKALK